VRGFDATPEHRDMSLLRSSLATLVTLSAMTASSATEVPLPPLAPWHGASEKLLENVPAEWRTPAEASGFATTPGYADTLAFLERLDRASPLISIHEFGRSSEGRPLVLVIASRDTDRDFAALRRSPRARVLAQGGIHSGEIDGKDAGLMLLRDIVSGRRADVLDKATLLFVPVFNPDGHERNDGTRRMNQRGPDNAGWRTTARNLNLNRDYTKLDAPETVALVKLIDTLDPDLYLDLHVTDGMDHQYDITYGFDETVPWSPASTRWLAARFRPAIDQALSAGGHIPGPFVMERDARDPTAGLYDGRGIARFSQGYGDLRHTPSVLVENHSLKPYRQRVLGTYLLVEESLRVAGREVEALRAAIAADRASRPQSLPIVFETQKTPARKQEFKAIAWEFFESPISGEREVRYLGKPVTQQADIYVDEPTLFVSRPTAYWVPASRPDVAGKLREHGVRLEQLKTSEKRKLTFYRLREPKLATTAFESRVTVSVEGVETETREATWPAGSWRVPTDQPLGDLAMVLLEPQSPDSLFAWGSMHDILQRTEYYENYILDPLAQRMLEKDPALRRQWEQALKDPAFAKDPKARLEWFYARSGLADDRFLLYPIARE
jgi:Zinc carboxypeptidase